MIQEHLRVQAVLFLDTLRFSGDNIHKRNDFAALRKTQVCADVRVGDSAGSDNRDTNHMVNPFCIQIPLMYMTFSFCHEYNRVSREDTIQIMFQCMQILHNLTWEACAC